MRGAGRRLLALLASLSLLPGPSFSQIETSYRYDALGRLIEAKDKDVPTGITARPVAYSYDDAGNRTRVSSGGSLVEIQPVAFTSSSTHGSHGTVTGLSPVKGMADLETRATTSVHVTLLSESGSWIRADLGSAQQVDKVDLAPANVSTWTVGQAQLDGAQLQYSADASAWTTVATISGAAINAYKTIDTNGVTARYWRVYRPAAGGVGLGEFRLFSGQQTAAAPGEGGGGNVLPFSITAGQQGEFNPFQATLGGVEPRALISYTQGTRTVVWVEPQRPDVMKYRVDGTAAGTDSFQFTLRDANNVEATYTVSLTIAAATSSGPTNYAPWLEPDTIRIEAGSTAVFYPIANDGDAEGEAIRLVSVSDPGLAYDDLTYDTVTGKVTYRPWTFETGEVNFTYSAVDSSGHQSTNGKIKIIIYVNSAPTANTDTITARPGIPKSFDPRKNDTDPEGDAITISGISTQPQHGTAAVSLGQAIVYTANAGYNGPDTFRYGLVGSPPSGTVNVTVQPNSAPVANDDSVTIGAGGATTLDPRANDTDVDDDVLKIKTVTTPSHGVVAIEGGGASITYTPQRNFTGVDTFIYTVEDGYGGTGQAKVTVTVDPNLVEYFVVAGGGGGSSAGVPGGGGGVLKGTLLLSTGDHTIKVGGGGQGGYPGGPPYYTSQAGTDGANSSIDSAVVAIGGGGGGYGGAVGGVNAGRTGGSGGGGPGGGSGPIQNLGGLGTPGQGYPGGPGGGGFDNWVVTGNAPGGGGGAGGPGRAGTTSRPGAGGPGLASDFSGVSETYAAGGGAGRSPVLYGTENGTAGDSSAGAGGYPGTPDAGSGPAGRGGGGGGGGGSHENAGAGGNGGSGVVMLRYRGPPRQLGGEVSQIGGYTLHKFTANGTFTAPANRRPTAVNDAISVRPGTSRTFDPRGNDQDPDGHPLYITAAGGASNGTASFAPSGEAVIYTPNAGATTDSFTYTVSDGYGGFATATVSVTVQANTAPDAVNDTLTVSAGVARPFDPLANDTDPQGDRLIITAVSTPTAGGQAQITADRRGIVFTAKPGVTTPDSFTYTVDDGQEGTDTATVNVTIDSAGPASFNISPAVNGKTTWNLNVDGSLNLGSAGVWTLTPLNSFVGQTKAWGAAGGGSGPTGASGGGGGYAGGSVLFQVGQSYRIDVGAAGINGAFCCTGGAGGGFTGVRKTAGDAILIAGAGGGSGWGYPGGAGGGETAQNGTSAPNGGAPGGAGGSQTAGALFQGGLTTTTRSGAGGGGYRGGATGVEATMAGGGGGGSGFAHPTEVTWPTLMTGSGATPGNTDDADRGGAGVGPSNYATTATSGRLILVGAVGPNRAPVAVDDARTITFGGEVVIDPRINDYDPDGNPLTVESNGSAAHGTVTRNGNVITYRPNADYEGQDTISYVISDGRTLTATANIVVTISLPTNTPPTTTKDVISTRANHPRSFNPLTNDSDVDLNAMTVTGAAGASHGTLSFTANSVTYTPAQDYAGPDAFTYTASDGHGGSTVGSVEVTVLANAFPVANDDLVWAPDNTPFDPRSNDTDAENDTITITSVGPAKYGTATKVNGQSVSYARQAGYSGPDSFTYTISDGEGGTATATVRVNSHVEYLVVAGGGGRGINPPDGEGGGGGAGGLRQGLLVLPANATAFQVTVGTGGTDGYPGSSGGRNGGPSSIGNLVTTTGGGGGGGGGSTGSPGGSGGGNGPITGATVGGAGVPGEGYAGSGFGDYVRPGTGGGAGGPAVGNNAGPGVFSAISGTNVMYAVGGATYGNGSTPGSAGRNGIVIVRYRTGALNLNGGSKSFFGNYTIHTFTAGTGPLNDDSDRPAYVVNDSLTAQTGQQKSLSALTNDSHPKGWTFSITGVGQPAHGQAQVGPGGTSVLYTSNPGYLGPDSFTYTVTDSHGLQSTGTISVTVVPLLLKLEYLVVAGGGSGSRGGTRDWDNAQLGGAGGNAGGLLQGDFEAQDGASLAVIVGAGGIAPPCCAVVGGTGGNSALGTLVAQGGASGGATGSGGVGAGGSPNSSNGGAGVNSAISGATLNYAAGGGGGASFLPHDPSASDDDENIPAGAAGGSSAGAGGPMYNGATSAPNSRGGGGGGAGGYAWMPGNGGSGIVIVRYLTASPVTVSGGDVTYSGPYTIRTFTSGGTLTVGLVNGAPVAVGDDAGSTTWNQTKTIDPRLNDYDPNGDTFTVTGVGAASHGATAIAAGGVGVTYTPNAGVSGPDSFSYTITDSRSGLTATANVTINVTVPNVAPVAVNDHAGDRPWNAPVTLDPRTNDSDANGDSLTIVGVGGAVHGATAITGGGTGVRYTPNTGVLGGDSFSYTIDDGYGHIATGTVSVNVISPNAPPTPQGDPVNARSAVALTFDPRGNDTDPDGNALTITGVSTGSQGGTITYTGTSVTYTSAAGFTSGTETFTYTVSDGNGGTANATVTVTVLAPVTWNSADKHSKISLDNGNLRAFDTTDTEMVPVRATLARASGRHYFEVTWGSASNAGASVGISTAASSLGGSQYVGRSPTSYGYRSTKYVYNNAAVVATYSTYGASAVIGVAVDLNARKIWFRKDGAWNGDPAAGTGGVDIAPGNYFPAVSLGSPEEATANFGATAFTYAAPTGYASWTDPAPPANAAPVAANDNNLSTHPGRTISFDPRANDVDPEGGALTIATVGAGSRGGAITFTGTKITYTPAAGVTSGTETFDYTVTDSVGASSAPATVTVTLLPLSSPATIFSGLINHATATPVTGSCLAGQVAIAYAANSVNRAHNSFTDNAGNTWTPLTEAVQGTSRLRGFRSVLSNAISGGTTPTQITLTLSGSGGAHVQVSCHPTGTAAGVQGANNGAAAASGGMSVTTGPAAAAGQMTLAFFLSNRWTSMSPAVPTGWTLGGDTTGGGTFGIKTYYQSVANGASPAAAFTTGMSSTTWMAAWAAFAESAP